MSEKAQMNESDLVTLLQSGDEDSFAYLYDRYSAALYGAILQVIPQKEKAEDVLQEVFIKIYRNVNRYDPSKGRLFTWMMQISRNAAIDLVRSQDYRNDQKNLELKESVYEEDVVTSNNGSSDAIGLSAVLKSLDEEHRKLIDLAYFKGFTQQEISSKLAVPVGTVKSRMRSALMHLRKILNMDQQR